MERDLVQRRLEHVVVADHLGHEVDLIEVGAVGDDVRLVVGQPEAVTIVDGGAGHEIDRTGEHPLHGQVSVLGRCEPRTERIVVRQVPQHRRRDVGDVEPGQREIEVQLVEPLPTGQVGEGPIAERAAEWRAQGHGQTGRQSVGIDTAHRPVVQRPSALVA